MALAREKLGIMAYVATLPKEDQVRVDECVAELHAVMYKYPDLNLIAIGILAADLTDMINDEILVEGRE